MVISVRPAPLDEKPVINALLQDYLDELSAFPGESIDSRDSKGTFHYPYLDAYWQEKERFPYFLITDSNIAGFALIRHETEHVEMAEFYVKPEFRRRGTGLTCATLIVREHPGSWYIVYNQDNYSACVLWQRLAELTSIGPVTSGMTDSHHEYLVFSTI